MSGKHLALLTPFVLGVVLLTVAMFDLSQFREGNVEARALLSRELPIVLFGLVSALIVFILGVVSLFQRKWRTATIAIVSSSSFIFCFMLGGTLGAAYLNAT